MLKNYLTIAWRNITSNPPVCAMIERSLALGIGRQAMETEASLFA